MDIRAETVKTNTTILLENGGVIGDVETMTDEERATALALAREKLAVKIFADDKLVTQFGDLPIATAEAIVNKING